MEYAEAGPVMRGDRSTEKVPLAEGVALKFFRDVLQVMLLVHAQIAESCDCLMLHMAQVVDQSNVGVLVYKGGHQFGLFTAACKPCLVSFGHDTNTGTVSGLPDCLAARGSLTRPTAP